MFFKILILILVIKQIETINLICNGDFENYSMTTLQKDSNGKN